MHDPDPDSSASLQVATVIHSIRMATVTASLGPVGPLLRLLTTPPEGVSESEIQSLTRDLEGLCVSLMDHSEAEEPSSTAMSWMSEIRELCYDIKNYFDDAPFISKQHDHAHLTPVEKQENAQLEFKLLVDQAKHASKRRKMYNIELVNIKKAKFMSLGRPLLPALLIDTDLMDNLENKLMGTAEEKKLKAVVSLVGLEGVGKTTLARRLYHQIGGQFQCRAFVRVSPNPDMRMLLTSIFKQIQLRGLSEPACCLDAQHLIKNIKRYLEDKRYLIIIDDLWSISVWDIIRRAFPDDVRGSRIIVTTQFEDVASACCSYKPEYICKMEPLKDDKSQKLLFSMIFGTEDHDGCPEGFTSVSVEIVRKCGGLPLLTVNVASLLPTPSDMHLQQWEAIRDSLPPTLMRNPSSEGIEEFINFMYTDLSPEVKTCLLYFAMYPEGYTVDKHDLVKQWVSEGFAGEGQNKEETALDYFDELVSRGMIQAVDINYGNAEAGAMLPFPKKDINYGKVLSCTLHHMVHDLIVKKSMEGNFVIGVDYIQSAVWLPDKVRRLSVQFGGARSARLPAGINLSEVRSLAYFGYYGCADFIEKCNLLRVLTLHVWADDCLHKLEERPGISPSGEKKVLTYDLSGFSKLLPLRYLKVACNVAVKLPDEIEALQYLEILEVDATIAAIPPGIGDLSRLSSLRIAVRELSRRDICILQALPALSALSLHVLAEPAEMIFEKGGFSLLGYLKFRCSVPWLKFEAGSMPQLQSLNLCFSACEADRRGIVPFGIEHLQGLKEINAEIWGADTDVGSTFRSAICNHPSNPRIDVQLVDSDSDLLPPAATGVPDTEMEAQESITDSNISASLAVAMGLPVTASLGPVGPLLRQLHSRPDGEIQRLTEDLDVLCISLMNHSVAEEPSYRAKCWMSEIRELCYDTKNYIDDAPFLLKQDEDDQLTAQEELTPEEKQEISMLRFKELEDRVTDASKRTKRYKIYPQNIKKAKFLSVARRRLPVLHPELIGRGCLMDELATLLRNGEEKQQQLEAVSLVGPEGVGKTTLAKLVYQKTGGEFQCRAFVRVSPNPDMRMLLASIFTQVQLPGSPEHACCLDAQHLIKSIKHYLKDKRYLIIIDDLWSISAWDIIRCAFPDDVRGSRIITTTQFEDVASACCSYKPGYICKMEPLEDDQSQKLLFSMFFGSEDHTGYSEDFSSVADGIIRKCGGLPLLTVNVASLLPTPNESDNLQQWMHILDSLTPTLSKDPTPEGMEQVVNFVFNNLSPELKTCLLYLAMYPEGYMVDKHDLVKQWVVEGFTGEGQNKEETAHEYFDDLVSRGMIQAVDINYRGVLSCTLHHMVHNLIVKKSVEGNFVIGVDNIQSAVWLPDKVHRLSVQFGGARSARLPAGITLSEVRSLAYFGYYGCADFIEKCNLLRVLTLHVWADDCVHQSEEEEERLGISPSEGRKVLTYDLSGISKLLPLRYLKVACNVDVKLPDEIEGLQYLETLEVDGATVVAIPSDIGRLSRLSSLKIAVRELSRQDICILQALPELSALSLHVWTTPTEMIVFNKGEFLVLKYFKFRCSVPCLKFEAGSMPDLQYLNLCFNAREADQHGIVPISIGHLPGLKEITAEIWGADTDVGSTFRIAISNHQNNPRINVQLVDSWIFYGDTATSMSKDDDIDKGEEEEKEDADSSGGEVSAYTRSFTLSSWGTASTSSFYAPSSSDWTASLSATADKRRDLARLPEARQVRREVKAAPVQAMEGALVGVGTGVMKPLLSKLSNLLEKEYTKLKGVRREVESTRDEMRSLKAGLEVLAEAEQLDPEMIEWRDVVRELSFDMEDCVDDFVARADSKQDGRKGLKGFFDKLKKLKPRHEIAGEIKELKARAIEASERLKRYKLNRSTPDSTTCDIDPRLHALYVEVDKLVGIEGPKKHIIDWFKNEGSSTQLQVVSIVGPGGLGKTTLGNAVFQAIKEEFSCKAFVSVSRKPNMKIVLKDIARMVGMAHDPSNDDEQWLIHSLREHLQDKKCLIMIDDLWSAEAWKIIRYALLNNEHGSRIITTTRNSAVASFCSSEGDYVYRMEPLSSDDSRRLFLGRAFRSEDLCPPHLKKVSERILEKCAGLPLAIITMSSLLADQTAKEVWNKALAAVGSSLAKEDVVGDMTKILSLSYFDLPHYMRACLLYLSAYPEDYIIKKKSLIHKWMAEGFIREVEGQSTYEVGEGYFNDFINRSLIQPAELSHFEQCGEVMACRVHDIILDFITCQAKEENFMTSFGDAEHRGKHNVRRLSVMSRDNGMATVLGDLSHVRSLAVLGYVWQNFALDFPVLRVLDLDIERCSDLENNHLANIEKLLLLKYLRLRTSYSITEIPEGIGKLKYLETLDMRGFRITKLPSTMTQLQRLARLYAKFEPACLSDGIIGQLQSLEELEDVQVSETELEKFLQELGQLTKLRTLSVYVVHSTFSEKVDNVRFLGTLISSYNLHHLTIRYDTRYARECLLSMESWCLVNPVALRKICLNNYGIDKIPNWMIFLGNLSVLHLGEMYCMGPEDIAILGGMPALVALKLKTWYGRNGKIFVRTGFRSLKYFSLEIYCCGTAVEFEEGSMPKLEHLELEFQAHKEECMNYAFDFGIQHLCTLTKLDLRVHDNNDFIHKLIETALGKFRHRPALSWQVRGPRECEHFQTAIEQEWKYKKEQENVNGKGGGPCSFLGLLLEEIKQDAASSSM